MTNSNKLQNNELRDFIKDGYPGYMCVLNHSDDFESTFTTGAKLNSPNLLLYCPDELCEGERWHTPNPTDLYAYTHDWIDKVLLYTCNNCKRHTKRYSISLISTENGGTVYGYKFGEFPRQEPRTHPRLLSLLGSDKELFLSGRRCELQGMGIAAFGYYRRVIEGRRNHILEQILKVAKRYNLSTDDQRKIESAKSDPRFQDSVKNIEKIIPKVLFVNGANPLSLLHDILSRGVHAESDSKCVELARDVRLVLGALVEQIDSSLKEHGELSDAIERLDTTE